MLRLIVMVIWCFAITTNIDAQATSTVTALAWNSDGMRLAVGYVLGQVEVVNLQTGDTVFTNSSMRIVSSLEWNPVNSDYLAIGGDTENLHGAVIIIDTFSGQVIHTLDGGESSGSLAWKVDGSAIAATSNTVGAPATSRNEIRVWDTATGELVTHSMYSVGPITSIAWSPDGRRIAGATTDSVIFIWDVVSGEIIHELNGHSDVVLSVAWSPDGARLASTGSILDNTLRIWDAATGDNTATLPSRFGVVKWSPDSSQLVVGESLSLRVLDASSGQEVLNVSTNELIRAIAYSPYGGRLAFSGIISGRDFQQNAINLLNSAIQIVVPDPSLERLQSIADLCDAPLTIPMQADQLSEFITQIESLPIDSIPPACAADLIAVAEAIRAGE